VAASTGQAHEGVTATATSRRCARCDREARYQLGRGSASSAVCFRHFVRSRPVARRAGLTAVFVGSVLTAINQGNVILAGDWSPVLFAKIPLTYAVPYCVTTWGALGSSRLQRD
jgi:hypothetical protein